MHQFFILFFCFSIAGFSQDDTLAKEYFKNGDYEKALIIYTKLYKKNPNPKTLFPLVETHQQLEHYNEAELLLIQNKQKYVYLPIDVFIGHNYALKKDTINAKTYYNNAIKLVEKTPHLAYSIGAAFSSHSLLDQAISTYKKAMILEPKLNFNIQLARIYGEQGEIEKMFNTYLLLLQNNTKQLNRVKRAFSEFISEDDTKENNQILKKILLKNIQKTQNVLWNRILSWLFIQEKKYTKAFAQEKAIYKRELEQLNGIEEIAFIALNDNKPKLAKTIFKYLIEVAPDQATKIKSNYQLLKIETNLANTTKAKENITKRFLELFKTYGEKENTLNLQLAYAHFLAFNLNESNKAINLLKKSLKLRLSRFQKAEVKLELGDILVLEERFNEALIYYTQIQQSLKNSVISQQARFKVAKTSYYKGDFKWAESQLKILKRSTTQLTANDALDLKLLISDNKTGDSLQTALKLYAKADLLIFQNKKSSAIATLNTIIDAHKTETIVAQARLKLGILYTENKDYTKAKMQYKKLITDFKDSILIDDALFLLANLYENQLANTNEAKALYEQIIFNHADSIYFIKARKRFRALRGDSIN